MARLRRRWRILKWAGLVTSLLILVVWAVSLRWVTYYEQEKGYHGWSVSFEKGRLGGGVLTYYRPQGPARTFWIEEQIGFINNPHKWLPEYERRPWTGLLTQTVYVPYWIAIFVVAIPTALLFWRDRRIPPGHCQKCGYNLTGNMSGVCPECGTRIQMVEPRKDK